MNPKRRLTVFLIIMTSYVSIVMLVCAMSWSASRGVKYIAQGMDTLYTHPYAVSNAAEALEGGMYHVRACMLEIALRQLRGPELNRHLEIAAAQEVKNLEQLEIIRDNYLGDPATVTAVVTKLHEWTLLRASVVQEMKAGRFARAQEMLRTRNSDKFKALMPDILTIKEFAHRKAGSLSAQATAQASAMQYQVSLLNVLAVLFVFVSGAVVIWRVGYLQHSLDLMATQDFLTGVATRRHFTEVAQRDFNLGRRRNQPVAVAVLDLDHFKHVNDTFGHPAGDTVLQSVCALSKVTLRSSDIIGRMGGEEFCILMPDTPIETAVAAIERVRMVIASTPITIASDRQIQITASFGVTGTLASDDSIEAMLARADKLLYKAKHGGRNRIQSDLMPL